MSPIRTTSYPHEHGCVVIQWSMSNLSEARPLKKTDCHQLPTVGDSLRSHQLPTAPPLEWNLTLLSCCARMLCGLILCKSGTGNHGYCEFMRTMALLISRRCRLTSPLFEISLALFHDAPWALVGENETNVPFCPEHRIVTPSLHFDQSLY